MLLNHWLKNIYLIQHIAQDIYKFSKINVNNVININFH